MTALNAAHGAALKDSGMQLALDYAGQQWRDAVLEEFRAWVTTQKARGEREVSIEMFRSQSTEQPTTHKAWGSLPKLAVKAGLIAPLTDSDGNRVYRRAASAKTHAHPVGFWRLL